MGKIVKLAKFDWKITLVVILFFIFLSFIGQNIFNIVISISLILLLCIHESHIRDLQEQVIKLGGEVEDRINSKEVDD